MSKLLENLIELVWKGQKVAREISEIIWAEVFFPNAFVQTLILPKLNTIPYLYLKIPMIYTDSYLYSPIKLKIHTALCWKVQFGKLQSKPRSTLSVISHTTFKLYYEPTERQRSKDDRTQFNYSFFSFINVYTHIVKWISSFSSRMV